LIEAIDAYRTQFTPSQQLSHPYVAAGVNVIAAPTDAEARQLFTSVQQQFTNRFRSTPGLLPAPIDDIEAYWTPTEKAQVSALLTYSFVGAPETVRLGLEQFIERTGVDELIVASAMYDHAARLRSYELLSELGMLRSDNNLELQRGL
jgi:alkanesulfonate monooxygenase SsuD/methylene tetrahydromethanopterin reductase-like flavin-dependent oxidoreductase (luciferase family)